MVKNFSIALVIYRIAGFLTLLCSLTTQAQSSEDSSSASLWGAVTPKKEQSAAPAQIQALTNWLKGQSVATGLPCPDSPFWLRNPRPQAWVIPFATLLASRSRSCNEQVLEQLKRHIGQAQDDRLVMWWILQSNFYNAYNEYRTAETTARQALRLSDPQHVFQGWAKLALSRSMAAQENDFPATYATINEVLELARQKHDQALEMQTLSLLGNINRRIYFGSSLKAIPYHQAALTIARTLRDTVQMGQEMMAMALNYGDARHMNKHVAYMLQLTTLLAKRDMPRIRARIFMLTGNLLRDVSNNNPAIAEDYYKKAFEISKLTGERISQEGTLNSLYELYTANGQYDKASLLLPRLDSLYGLMARHLSFVPSTNFEHYQALKRAGDKAGALAYLEKEYSSITQQYQTQNSASLAQWEAVFQTKEKDRMLKQQAQQQQNLISVIGLISLLLITGGVAFYYQLKNRRAIGRQMKLIETQAEQLQRVDQMKTHFFANISHELRTPLTLIIGPLGSVLNRQRLDEPDAKLVGMAQHNARQLLELVGEILNLSKLEAGKLEMSLQPVRLSDMIRLTLTNFDSLAHHRAVTLGLVFDATESLLVELDVDKLRKVLTNLLSNAFKATQPGDTITLGVQTHHDRLLLRVSDTGRGIHPDDLPHVFDRYFQSNRPDAAVEGGTGIGLALCQEYARAMQGRLTVESQWEQGTTFILDLPLREASGSVDIHEPDFVEPTGYVSQGSLAINARPPGPGETVLVVEDNPDLRDYLMSVLQPTCTVLTAGNGQDALNQLAQAATLPSLIISDVMMPQMDGFQLLDRLKASDTYRLIPVIMLTARADKADKLRALRIGVDDYLLKPFDEDELLLRVTSLLTNQKERQRHLLMEMKSDSIADNEEAPALTASADDMAWLAKLETATMAQLGNADLTAERLADDMAVSRSTLFREVKRLTGLTPTQYIMEARFQRARQLLEDREVSSVKQLAGVVGFRQIKHFSASYKKQFGKSPSDYF